MDGIEHEIAELRRDVAALRRELGRRPVRFAIGGGGGGATGADGLKIYYAPTYTDLALISPGETFAMGFTTAELQLWGWWNDSNTWYCLSHIKGLG